LPRIQTKTALLHPKSIVGDKGERKGEKGIDRDYKELLEAADRLLLVGYHHPSLRWS
jgi:hypothetical protein